MADTQVVPDEQMRIQAATRVSTARAIEAIAGLRNIATMVTTTAGALDLLQQLEIIEDEVQKARHAAYGWIESGQARVSG